MTVVRALEIIDIHIENLIAKYSKTSQSKDADGAYISHYLEDVSEIQKLHALDQALKYACIRTVPLRLLESDGSVATEFRRVGTTSYIRVPNTPTVGAELDIDESLAYAAVYNALGGIDDEFSRMERIAQDIFAAYNEAYRDRQIIDDLGDDNEVTESNVVLFRFSPDGESGWTDGFKDGDKYISFKNGEIWSDAVKFVGDDGSGESGSSGGGSESFKDLTDTPSTLIAGKFFKVAEDGETLELTDAPSGDGGSKPTISGNWDVSGIHFLNLLKTNEATANTHYLLCNGDADVRFPLHNMDGVDYLNIEMGVKMLLYVFPQTHNVTIGWERNDTRLLGDGTIDSTKEVTVFEFFYDGLDIIILNKKEF